MIILVRNIDRAITEMEMRKVLEKHGKVRSFDLVLDKATGQSKGFGFADMPGHDEALAAVEALDGFQVGTLKLRVKRAASSSLLKEPPPSRPKPQKRPRPPGKGRR
ncbi:RNA-binding protein [Haloferula sp. BvORR071]|uniref:RNA recognition motif domain-containing protein n=1 Tax=Haloferula sp. BvORR071 TaxID=1396141 RepID=UPI00054D6B50|nr:RNA-binding protein [Haloferula sp. BvORR071]